MVNALANLGNSIVFPPICRFKDLGQTFDEKGNPKNKNLRHFKYKDKSKFQWSFACYYNYDKNRIDIVKMMPSSHIVKESKEKRKKIILTENDLKAMVKECVRRIMRR